VPRAQHREAKDSVLPTPRWVCGKPTRVRFEWPSIPRPCERESCQHRVSSLLSKPAAGPRYRSISRVKTIRRVLAHFGDCCQNRVVIQGLLPRLVRRGSHRRYVRHDTGHRLPKIGQNNLCSSMDNRTDNPTGFPMQLGECSLHVSILRKVCIVVKTPSAGGANSRAPVSRPSTFPISFQHSCPVECEAHPPVSAFPLFRFQVSGFRFQVSGFRFQVSASPPHSKFKILNSKFSPATSFRFPLFRFSAFRFKLFCVSSPPQEGSVSAFSPPSFLIQNFPTRHPSPCGSALSRRSNAILQRQTIIPPKQTRIDLKQRLLSVIFNE
jgi:hypothetical protein